MKRKNKLLAALALTLVLCLLPATMLAGTYSVAEGDITVELKDGKQNVKRGDTVLGENDANPVLTGLTSSNVIKLISVDEGGIVKVTLHGLDMHRNGSLIEIGDDVHVTNAVTNAVINLEGKNQLINNDPDSQTSAIHIKTGSLTITAKDNDDENKLKVLNSGYGAAIGSNFDEKCDAYIRITGNADVNTYSNSGACIGGGDQGGFAGRIVIDGNAKLQGNNNGISNYLAVLGSGMEGAFTGSIEIKDNAEVELRKWGDATLGQSYSGTSTKANGNITLDGSATIRVLKELYLGGFESVPDVQVKIGDGVQFFTFDPETGDYTIPIEVDDELIHITGTLVEEPTQACYAQYELYRVVDKDGSAVAYDESVEDGVVTITAAEGASLVGALEDIQMLSRKGSTLRFVTGDVVSTVELAEFYHGVGSQTDEVVLSHNGGRTLTIGGVDYTAFVK